MRLKNTLTLGAISSLLLAACMAESEPAPEPAGVVDVEGVSITVRDGDRFEGSYTDALGAVEFASRRNGDTGGSLVLFVNGKRFDVVGELSTSFVEADGYGQVLTDDDKMLLASAADRIMYALGVEHDYDLPYFERLPIRNSLYFSEAPARYAHGHVVEGVPPVEGVSYSLADDGVIRLQKWRLYKGQYDKGYGGKVYSFKCTTWKNWGTSRCDKGDYGCMGRCGGGCGGAGTKYPYRDCLEHDVCSHNLCAVAGIASINCGDEYKHAIDDFNAI